MDYLKLVDIFGCKHIDTSLMQKIEYITHKPAHYLLKRSLMFAHRDLEIALEDQQKGEPFYLYTGRGPSSGSLHFGHLLPFMFTKYLQDAFKVPLVIQITDDEKYFTKEDIQLDQAHKYAIENIKDIIAMGFDRDRTFIFSNMDYVDELFTNVCRIQKHISNGQMRAIFGIRDRDNVGKTSFPAFQAAPAFSSSFKKILENHLDRRCLVPCGIDQDPYFRMTRDVASKLGHKKPSLIMGKFLPSLLSVNEKMGSSQPNSAIFVSDSDEDISVKVRKYAFSGGKDTLAEHRKYGANLGVDVTYSMLQYLHPDDDLLNDITRRYSSGDMTTNEIKKILIKRLSEIANEYRLTRAQVSDGDVTHFMSRRRLLN